MAVDYPGMKLFLKCHGPLLRMLPDGGMQLTTEGRLYVVSFLVCEGFISREDFASCVGGSGSGGLETNRMIARQAGEWLKVHEKDELEGNYPETDMSLNSIRALLAILIASQKNFELSLQR